MTPAAKRALQEMHRRRNDLSSQGEVQVDRLQSLILRARGEGDYRFAARGQDDVHFLVRGRAKQDGNGRGHCASDLVCGPFNTDDRDDVTGVAVGGSSSLTSSNYASVVASGDSNASFLPRLQHDDDERHAPRIFLLELLLHELQDRAQLQLQEACAFSTTILQPMVARMALTSATHAVQRDEMFLLLLQQQSRVNPQHHV